MLLRCLVFCLRKTLPVSKLGCVLCQDVVAFCLEDFLHFVLTPQRFISRLSCVLSPDLLHFVSRLTAFCLQSVAFCLQGRFVTAIKLKRGLKDSNYDQLYTYLKQHETHAKENKMMLERFSQNTLDPLALMSNVSNPQLYSPSSSTSSSTQAQENGVAWDAEQLLFLAGGQHNAFDDDATTAQTMFMANLSSADPVTDEARPSYDLDILKDM
nr:integrase, catalytic region, zinc finger, CCHC-type, peptidase aspartic, catalytic [Tanacetum cinerariifolium]